MLRALRIASRTEATSHLLLLVAVAVELLDGPSAVAVVGPIHGVLYLVFAALVLRARRPFGWAGAQVVNALVIGALPLGGFWLDRRWFAPMAAAANRL
ncbi:MAG: DUF3817 domain-containing protein [Actinomycetota bacterium]